MTQRQILFVSLLAALPAGAVFGADPAAAKLSDEVTAAMGGLDNWNRAHFVRFDFIVNADGKTMADRSHIWDKMTGRYRLESQTKDGKRAVTLFNTADQKGTAYVDGKKLEGPASAKAIKDAYGTFINDSYWLSMPLKWKDPGVNLKYLGKRTHDGKSYDVVQLTFGKVGLTPGDHYEAYVSPVSHLMEHWEYILQSGNKGSWNWEYTATGGVKLAKNHISEDKKSSISMGDVKIMDSADDALFTDPAKSLR